MFKFDILPAESMKNRESMVDGQWIDPITDHPDGSFPFRTGISAVRLAIADIIKNNQKKVTYSYFSKRVLKKSN